MLCGQGLKHHATLPKLQLGMNGDRGIHTPVNALHGHALCFQLVSLRFGPSIPGFVKL